MPRTPIIVKLDDGLDHFILDGEVTACGRIVPQATPWEESTSKPCPVCFPDTKGKRNKDAAMPETEAEAIAATQEKFEAKGKK